MGDWETILVLALVLLALGLRVVALDVVPPGWRDDGLISMFALSGQVLEGHFPLYFTGASGHEPLYHYLHAAVLAVLGLNVISGHLLSIALGILSICLTYVLTRRMFGRATAVMTMLGLTTSFWSLMYSRMALRHISASLFAAAVSYGLWRCVGVTKPEQPGLARWSLVGLLLGTSVYTYTATRALPVLLIAFAIYLALWHRDRFRRSWRGFLLALLVAAAVSAPLWIAISRGRSEAAAMGIGADARLDELAVPLRELQAGNVRPLLENTWATLGMFHATGDPEWLYNVAGRPVFNLLGGVLLWLGVALCVIRWRQPRYAYLLLWLGVGLAPAFVSHPPASLSHTMLDQPAAYILPALFLKEAWSGTARQEFRGRAWLRVAWGLGLIAFLVTNPARDLVDYYVTWPQDDMTRVLHRADYRDAARYLGQHPEITDVAITGTLFGPWDRLALEIDTQRDVAIRLFNPDRALVCLAGDGPSDVLLTAWPEPDPPITDLLQAHGDPVAVLSPRLMHQTVAPVCEPRSQEPLVIFSNGLALAEAYWMEGMEPAPGHEAVLLTNWHVAEPLDLPPMDVIANPPPPGVYSGPRLAVFAHVLAADGMLVAGDDGLWVDPYTLQVGDRFIQVHRFQIAADAPAAPYDVAIGLYDPMDGERWSVRAGAEGAAADQIVIPAAQ